MAEIPTEHLPENAHMTLWDPRGSEPLFDYIERPFDKEVSSPLSFLIATAPVSFPSFLLTAVLSPTNPSVL